MFGGRTETSMLESAPYLDDVSRETLSRYEGLIRKWNTTIQLVSPADLPNIWERHIMDAVELAGLVPKSGVQRLVDLGSGGGLPGIVIAIIRPDLVIDLVESDLRKSAFLRAMKRDLVLTNVHVHTGRIEAITPLRADVVTARAVAPLAKLLQLGTRHGQLGTIFLFPKGLRWRDELLDAETAWSFGLEVHERAGEGRGPTLKITDLRAKETGNG
jgi:16S rRNA (guanine527-N7)-methyltransferase